MFQYSYSGLCWITKSNFVGYECTPNMSSFNLLALTQTLIQAVIQFNLSYIVSEVHFEQEEIRFANTEPGL